MSSAQRGLITFAVVLVIAVIFCGIVPFSILPSIDSAMALPVIQLPGEILWKDVPVFGTWTNTLTGIVLTDIVVLLIAFVLRNPKRVPRGFQNLFEVIVDYLYGMTKQVAGIQHAPRIFPLVATIFLVVLTANWLELVPGVDSVGIMHCAHEGQRGYPVKGAEAPFDGDLASWKVSEAQDSGTAATEDDYHACEEKWFEVFDHGDEEHSDDAEHSEDADHSEDDADHSEDEATDDGGEGDEVASDESNEDDHEDEAAADDSHAEDGEGDHASSEGHGEANPDLLVVTPFVRAAATDLNFTLALALISVVAVQFYGVRELGVSYVYKFINLPALGNAGKNPMGVMDFGVGILELISEISKIISFAFRLLGNIFAGQVLLFVIPFLVATLLPSFIYGLELFVGLIQAFVFFMLTLVFIRLGMESHGDHDDEDHHH